MKVTKKDLKLFRTINIIFVLISILVILFINEKIGFGLLALSLFFLLAPYKEGDSV